MLRNFFKRHTSKDIICYSMLIIAATLFITILSWSTSFLYPTSYGNDSTVFMYIGRGIKYGYVPYRDMYDTKGPILWLIEYIGQFIYEGRYGIFFLEIINYNIIVFLTYRMSRYYLTEAESFIAVIISMVFLTAVYEAGNAVEEFSYLWSMLALYFIVKAVKTQNGFLKKRYFIIYGISAMCSALIRVTDCVIAGVCIIYAGIELVRQRRIKSLIINYLITLGAAMAVLLPFVIYYWLNGALYDWFDATVLFSIKYTGFNKVSCSIKSIAILFFPIVIAVYKIITGDRHISLLMLMMSVVCIVMYIIIGTKYLHYMMITIPCISLMCIIALKEIKKLDAVSVIIIAIVFCCTNYIYIRGAIVRPLRYIISEQTENKSSAFAERVNEIIGDNHHDSVYTYYVDNMIAFVNKTYSHSKYFQAQGQWSADKDMKDKIYNDFIDGDNYWVITSEYNMMNYDERISQELNNNYILTYTLDSYMLFKKGE